VRRDCRDEYGGGDPVKYAIFFAPGALIAGVISFMAFRAMLDDSQAQAAIRS
jgi:hypothetical protein